jgi:hypothetical protein
MPQVFILLATSKPMRPSPSTAKVLPCNSVPEYSLRSHRPCFMLSAAGHTGRAKAPNRIQVSSHADIEFPPGVLWQLGMIDVIVIKFA